MGSSRFIILALCMISVGLSEDSCNLIDTVRGKKVDSKDAVVIKISEENVESPEECYETCCDLTESDGCTTAEYMENKNSCNLYKCESAECPTKRSARKVLYYIGTANQTETTTVETPTTPTQDTVSSGSSINDTSTTSSAQHNTSTESTSQAPSSVTTTTEASMSSEATQTQSSSQLTTTEIRNTSDNSTEEQDNVSSTTSTMMTSLMTQSSFTTSTLDGTGNETPTNHEAEKDGPGFVLIVAIVVASVIAALMVCVLVGKWMHGYCQRRNYTEMD